MDINSQYLFVAKSIHIMSFTKGKSNRKGSSNTSNNSSNNDLFDSSSSVESDSAPSETLQSSPSKQSTIKRPKIKSNDFVKELTEDNGLNYTKVY